MQIADCRLPIGIVDCGLQIGLLIADEIAHLLGLDKHETRITLASSS